MFGNLRPAPLQGCARGRYQSAFCGSCHALAESGRGWSLTTGYDLAFLAFVAAALEGAPQEHLPCTALPFRQVSARRLSPTGRRWLSAVNFLLLAEKCRDDLADERSLKARLSLALVARQETEARDFLLVQGISLQGLDGLAERQSIVESQRGDGLDHYALPTSQMLGQVFGQIAWLLRRNDLRPPLLQLGQGLGAAIYLKDALKDRSQDQKRGRFNAVVGSGVTIEWAQTALRREIRRAQCGLRRLNLPAADLVVAQSLIQELAPSDKSEAHPIRRPRRAQMGVLDCACDALSCCDGLSACEGATCCLDCGHCCACDCDGCSYGSTEASRGKAETAAALVAASNSTPLHCPACGGQLEAGWHDDVELDECRSCFGLWFDKGELEKLTARQELPRRLLRRLRAVPQGLRPEGTRLCPRCSELLTATPVKGVTVDLCGHCQGLWLDQGELEKLL